MPNLAEIVGQRAVVVVANRLPVDRAAREETGAAAPAGVEPDWQTAPGGLVTAMEPVVAELGCVWVGWAGVSDEALEPFEHGSMKLVPVELTAAEVESYYEGFSNATLWPLYHDVIEPPEYHREWWEGYEQVNRRFAERTAQQAPLGALVWVHDYQLQLVPHMLRQLRPDLTIAFFLHIPFPGPSLFAQLPWRRQIVRGLLGADVIGFQRAEDAASFRAVAERFSGAPANGNIIVLPEGHSELLGSGNASIVGSVGRSAPRAVVAQEFPISIDVAAFERLAADPDVRARAREIRRELGDPQTLLLGVDRLDYTKGIGHRLKAYAELLEEGETQPDESVLVQVASPSRERVEAYQRLRDEIEAMVGRINGDYGTIGHTPVVYLHRGHARDEMAALYLAADVLVVTSLRDGMNLVAKEYVACRSDEHGVLVLSEFAGAAEELAGALLVNPHDIEGLKAALLRAIRMPEREQRRRMRQLHTAVAGNDVGHWAAGFLRAAIAMADQRDSRSLPVASGAPSGAIMLQAASILLPTTLETKLQRLATAPELMIACDFDGTLAPIVSRPEDARANDRSQRALAALSRAEGVTVALLSGRSKSSLLSCLASTGAEVDGWVLIGSHGAEAQAPARREPIPGASPEALAEALIEETPLTGEESHRLALLRSRIDRAFGNEPGVVIETKPFGFALHTRRVEDEDRSDEILEAVTEFGAHSGWKVRTGKRVREFSQRHSDKGTALTRVRRMRPAAPLLFIGDDVTDEDAFAVLRVDDLGVKVGEGETRADERVADPEAVGVLLARLVELRTGQVIGTTAEW